MQDSPLVSIITPFRDAADYLPEAIQSVLDQEYRNWELLAIDNGSIDEGAQIVRSFNDARIHLLQAPKAGVSYARNAGLEASRGAYICFLDADDRLTKSSLKIRVAALQRFSNADFCDGTVHFFERRFERQLRVWQPSFSGKPLDELVGLTGSCFMGISWMCRSTSIGKIRFPEGQTHSEDLSFYLQLASTGGDYIFVEASIYDVRVRTDSAMSALSGLESGYASIARQLPLLHVNAALQQTFRRRVRRILFRSYLKRLQPVRALKAYRRWSSTQNL